MTTGVRNGFAFAGSFFLHFRDDCLGLRLSYANRRSRRFRIDFFGDLRYHAIVRQEVDSRLSIGFISITFILSLVGDGRFRSSVFFFVFLNRFSENFLSERRLGFRLGLSYGNRRSNSFRLDVLSVSCYHGRRTRRRRHGCLSLIISFHARTAEVPCRGFPPFSRFRKKKKSGFLRILSFLRRHAIDLRAHSLRMQTPSEHEYAFTPIAE